ncbi:MAG: hypothetical protein ACFFDI_30555 [Promethearchaeota archaeon]
MNEEVKRTPSLMKECIRRFYYENWFGDPTAQENFVIVRWIILELNRMGFNKEEVLDKMIDWAKRSYPSISPRKMESLKRHVLAILESPHELGCPKSNSKYVYQSKLSDICFRDVEPCIYYEEFGRLRHNLSTLKINETNYHRYGWPEYLHNNFGQLGFYADKIYGIFREWECKYSIPAGEKLCISFRKMVKLIAFNERDVCPLPMQALRATRILEDVGLIKLVEHGKRRGEKAVSQPRANGYRRIIPIPKPPENRLE